MLRERVGFSTQGRPIELWRAGPSDGAPLLVVAGVHGDEPASVEAVVEWARTLDHQGTGPAAASAADLQGGPLPVVPQRPVWIIPRLNPDGLAAGTKNTARHVDLNRNFPARNFRLEHRPGYFPGERPLSEPEARALSQVLKGARFVGVVAVHAPFACVNYDGPAAPWAEAISARCGWPVQADIGYPTPGSLGSWLGWDLGMRVITLELPAGPYAPFRAQAQEALNGALEAA